MSHRFDLRSPDLGTLVNIPKEPYAYIPQQSALETRPSKLQTLKLKPCLKEACLSLKFSGLAMGRLAYRSEVSSAAIEEEHFK